MNTSRGTAIALAIGAGLALGPMQSGVAFAGEYYNEYSVTGLPEFAAAPTPFTVTAEGPDAVCTAEYDSESVEGGGPWVFTFNPSLAEWEQRVDFTMCDGDWRDSQRLDAVIPFAISTSLVTTDDSYRQNERPSRRTVVVENFMPVSASIEVKDAHGKVVGKETMPPAPLVDEDGYLEGRPVLVTFSIGGVRGTTRFHVVATGANGISMSFPVLIADGWAPFSDRTTGSWAPCSTVTWSYRAQGQPRSASTFKKDVKASLRRLGRITGLTFVETPDGAEDPATGERAALRISWRNLGTSGPSGVGGTDGTVEFNTQDYWVTNRYAGFGDTYRSPAGRGWLIVHEVMHTMQFAHVNSRTAIMGPINYGQHHFTKGDLEGLRALYPTAGCGRS